MEILHEIEERKKPAATFPVRHLPPTAFQVKWEDLRGGFTALLEPQEAVDTFRAGLKHFTGSSHCHLVSSGRSALVIVLLALKELSPRTKVILPAYSCPTVVQAILQAGLDPVFCDVSPHTLDMDRHDLDLLLDQDPLAVIPTHLYGLPVDITDLLNLARDLEFFVIEDAAQALGAKFGHRPVGYSGHAGIFSLGMGKCLPTGHGGVIISQDRCAESLSDIIETIVPRQVQRPVASLVRFMGYAMATRPVPWWFIARSPLNPGGRGELVESLPPIHMRPLDATQAGIGNSLLKRLQANHTIRRRNAERMISLLSEFAFLSFIQIPPQAEATFLRLPLVVQEAQTGARLFSELWRLGIGVSRSYRHTLPTLFAGHLPRNDMDYPGATHLANCLFTLPTHSYLTEADFSRMVEAFHTASRRGG